MNSNPDFEGFICLRNFVYYFYMKSNFKIMKFFDHAIRRIAS